MTQALSSASCSASSSTSRGESRRKKAESFSPERATTIFALIVHELATNSLKYGALSVDTGALDVSCSAAHDDAVTVVWTETGGPKVTAPRELAGYGSKLIERSVAGHLRGSIKYDWAEDGVIVTLKVDPARLAA